ncbi:MAG: GMC family oxidoreductase [SAR324 cluster bacterium]|nr:GMC family oxidoreductase [SAR324 cluster bacterium]
MAGAIGLGFEETLKGWIQWFHHKERNPLILECASWSTDRLRWWKPWKIEGKISCPGRFYKNRITGTVTIHPLKHIEYDLLFHDSKLGNLHLKGKKEWLEIKMHKTVGPLNGSLFNSHDENIGDFELKYQGNVTQFMNAIRFRQGHPHQTHWSSYKETILALAETVYPEVANNENLKQKVWERFLEVMEWMPSTDYKLMDVAYRHAGKLGWAKGKRSFAQLSLEERIQLMDSIQRSSVAMEKLTEVLQIPLRIAAYSDEDFHKKLHIHIPRNPQTIYENEPWQKNIFTPSTDLSLSPVECDVVVIGSGAGGAAIADILTRKYNLAVAIVEEGMFWDRRSLQDSSFRMTAKLYRYFGMQRTEGTAPILIPTGIGVGGTTLINCGTSFRTPESVINRWNEELNVGISVAEMKPFFEQVEQKLHVQPGEKKYLGPIADVVAAGADKLGYSHHPLPRSALGCDGQGACSTGCPSGAKMSTNVSYIPSALKHGASLFTGYRAEQILVEHGQAVGVIARVPGVDASWNLKIRAKCVILAAGSLITPRILYENGIAENNPHLGHHLSIHPAVNVGGLFRQIMQVPHYIPQSYAIDHFHHEGIMFEGAALPPEFSCLALPVLGSDFLHYMNHYKHYANFGFMIQDTSHGNLKLSKGKSPKINYNLDEKALNRITRGTTILGNVLFEGGAEEIITQVSGRARIKNASELQQKFRKPVKAREINATAYHPLGTCRFGSSPQNSVVSPEHEVWGVKNLFIADGSVVPGPLGVNPQITIMGLALRAGQIIGSRF